MSQHIFLDTNVFVAALTDEPDRGATATRLLNQDHEFYTSLLNLMELRTVLTKKKQVEQEQVGETIRDISEQVHIVIHESSDIVAGNDLQRETLLYPMDCLVLAVANDLDTVLATFDRELIDAGAESPETLLED